MAGGEQELAELQIPVQFRVEAQNDTISLTLMQKLGDILKTFNPTEDKYISREFQAFGMYLTEKLDDPKRRALYMKFAKTLPRPALQSALKFVVDSKARNKAALFMWKLKEMGILGKGKKPAAKKEA